MTTIFFAFALYIMAGASICGLIGYRWKDKRWCGSLGEYLGNFCLCLLHAAGAAAFLWVYLQVFSVEVRE